MKNVNISIIKDGKKKKLSSQQWLLRNKKDPFIKKAKDAGYRSRASYKLIQINEKYQFIKQGKNIVDLGSSPGGWSQVVADIVGNTGKIVAIDITKMEPIKNVIFLNKSIEECINEYLCNNADVIISDMAPSASGNNDLDHIRSINLAWMAFEFAKNNLSINGDFLIKILQGKEEKELFSELKKHFLSIKYIKPPASRKKSSEIYIFSQGFTKNYRNL